VQRLSTVLKENGKEKEATEADTIMKKYYDLFMEKVYDPAQP
jgi:hypothetical protein